MEYFNNNDEIFGDLRDYFGFKYPFYYSLNKYNELNHYALYDLILRLDNRLGMKRTKMFNITVITWL